MALLLNSNKPIICSRIDLPIPDGYVVKYDLECLICGYTIYVYCDEYMIRQTGKSYAIYCPSCNALCYFILNSPVDAMIMF